MIEVRLFATFRENRGKIIFQEYKQGMTGLDVIQSLDIQEQEIAIFLINGHHSKLNMPLEDNSVLALFPPVGGG